MSSTKKTQKTVMVLLLSALLIGLTPAVSAGNFLKDLARTLEKQAKEQLEEAREQAEETARVRTPDRSVRPSWVIRTTNGATYQVRDVAFTTSITKLDSILKIAESAKFSRHSGTSYTVRVRYQEVGLGQSPSGQALEAAVVDTLNTEEYSTFRGDIHSVMGEALDGRMWVLYPGQTTIASMELID